MVLKRIMDITGAVLGLIILSPVFVLIGILVRIAMGSPVLFSQLRPGLNNRPFRMYKFRTMTNKCDQYGKLLPDEQRLTTFGSFLRSSSLDEIPELFNVLKGDMSMVGPRPLLMKYLERYTSEQARRHAVKPGITGWAQINGRNALSWEEKFKLDLWYVDNWSVGLDLKIVFLTFIRIIRKDDINAEGHATMPEFMGYSDEHNQSPGMDHHNPSLKEAATGIDDD